MSITLTEYQVEKIKAYHEALKERLNKGLEADSLKNKDCHLKGALHESIKILNVINKAEGKG